MQKSVVKVFDMRKLVRKNGKDCKKLVKIRKNCAELTLFWAVIALPPCANDRAGAKGQSGIGAEAQRAEGRGQKTDDRRQSF